MLFSLIIIAHRESLQRDCVALPTLEYEAVRRSNSAYVTLARGTRYERRHIFFRAV